MSDNLRALTLWQPMAWAISDYTKRIENRPWKPWPDAIGRRLAIHAGSKYHRPHAEQIRDAFGVDVPRRLPQGAIVAVCTVVDYVHEDDHPNMGQRAALVDDPWFSGPFGWVLGNVVKMREPVPCKGSLGLWRVPPKQASDVLEQSRDREGT